MGTRKEERGRRTRGGNGGEAGTFGPSPHPVVPMSSRLPISPLALFLPLGVAAAGAAAYAARAPLSRRLVYSGVARQRKAAGFTRHETVVDGRRTAWLERPGDGPTVVLVHGFNGGKDVWLRYARHVPPGWRLVAPDLPGHGESEADADIAYDPAALAEALVAWLDAVAPGTVHLAGSSLGGEVATRVALAHPDRVASLALFNPAGVAPPEPSDMDRLAEAGDYVLIPTDRETLDRLYTHVFASPPDIPAVARTVFAADAAARAPFMRALLERIAEGRDALREQIPLLRVPTLVVWGEHDRVLHPSSASVWEGALPDGSRLHVLPGIGHAPMMEAPAATAALHERLVEAVPEEA